MAKEKERNPIEEQEKLQEQKPEAVGNEADFWRDAKYTEDKAVSER